MSKVYQVPTPPEVGHPFGAQATVLLRGSDTANAYGLVEARMSPGNGPPLHTHSREDETFYVIEGLGEFTVGDQKIRAGPGSCLFGPRGVPHRYENVGQEELKLILVYSPAGFELSFLEMDKLPMGPELVAALRRYGLT